MQGHNLVFNHETLYLHYGSIVFHKQQSHLSEANVFALKASHQWHPPSLIAKFALISKTLVSCIKHTIGFSPSYTIKHMVNKTNETI